MLMHTRPVSQGEFFIGFELHSQVGGIVVLLQVSEFSRQCDESKHEQAGCPGRSVRFTHTRFESQGPKDGSLFSHPHIEGDIVALHVSEFS